MEPQQLVEEPLSICKDMHKSIIVGTDSLSVPLRTLFFENGGHCDRSVGITTAATVAKTSVLLHVQQILHSYYKYYTQRLHFTDGYSFLGRLSTC